jgi:hypothetical protein
MATLTAIAEFERLSVEYVRLHINELRQILDSQRNIESQIIKQTNSTCPLDQLKNRTVRAESVQRALQEGFGDANILKAIMCMNNSMLTYPNSDLESSFKVRHYLENLKQIGEESVEGYAMSAQVNSGQSMAPGVNGENLFITKAPRRIDQRLRLNQLHEYFIGAFGTNSLRNEIPNFAFTMGFFQCSPAYIDSYSYVIDRPINPRDRRALTYCQNDVTQNQVNYLLYENVADSLTLNEFIIRGCTFQEYLNIFTQIVLALDLAYRRFDFTHYDLHDQNVLIRKLPREIIIPYEIDGVKNYLHTRYIATIIDLGRSHIKYNGQHFGFGFIETGIYPTHSYPMYDIYKLLMFSLLSAGFGNSDEQRYAGLRDDQIPMVNRDVYDKAKEMIAFFNPYLERNTVTNDLSTSANYLISTLKYYYSLPYSPQLDISPAKFFQNVILNAYPNYVQDIFQTQISDLDPVYGCANNGTCYSLEQAIMEYSQPDIKYIDDAYSFYEMIAKARVSPNSSETLQQLISQGDIRYESYMNQLRNDRNKFTNEYNQIIQGYSIVSLQMGAPDNIKFQSAFMDLYRRFIDKSVKLIDILTSISQIEAVIQLLNELYPTKAQQTIPGLNYRYIDISRDEFNQIRSSASGLNDVIMSIKQDAMYVESLNPYQIIRTYPDTVWLFQKMPVLTSAISQF